MRKKPSILWIGFCFIFSVFFLHRGICTDIHFIEGFCFIIVGICLFFLGSTEFNKLKFGKEGGEHGDE